jgi:curli biogenesis system outer membrane secretion channel CsgG
MSNKPILFVTTSLLIATLGGWARAEDPGLPALIVAPFQGNSTVISYWQPAVGEGLAEMLVTELAKLNKFQVLENSQLGVLKDEMKLGDDGFIAADEKVEKGGWAAADFMFTAKVTQFGNKESKVNLGGFVPGNLGSLGVRQTLANVRIDWRLVDAATRKIVKAGSAAGEHKGGGFDVGANIGGSGGRIGFDNKEFVDSALGKATVKALTSITTELGATTVPESGRHKQKGGVANAQAAAAAAVKAAPGKVLAVAGPGIIVVSLGSNQGFKSGDKLNLYETVDTKNDKGEVVFTDEKLVGEITLQSVQEDRSKAACDDSLAVKAGWVVKGK